jgi:hypothetical protein
MPGRHEIHAWTVSAEQARQCGNEIFEEFVSNPGYDAVALIAERSAPDAARQPDSFTLPGDDRPDT